MHALIQRGVGHEDRTPPHGLSQICRYTGPDFLENHKATMPAFNVVPSSGVSLMNREWPAFSGI